MTKSEHKQQHKETPDQDQQPDLCQLLVLSK